MKKWSQRLVIFAVMVMLIITPFFEKTLYAWTVTIQNNTIDMCEYQVLGNHLYWSAIECTGKVGPSATAECHLPPAICPHLVSISCLGKTKHLGYDNFFMIIWSTKCWNSIVTIPQGDVMQTQWN